VYPPIYIHGGVGVVGEADKRASQIDMVIERGDNTINLCGMKFSEGEFAINKDYRFDSIQIDYP
jgi:hypothetical protein